MRRFAGAPGVLVEGHRTMTVRDALLLVLFSGVDLGVVLAAYLGLPVLEAVFGYRDGEDPLMGLDGWR